MITLVQRNFDIPDTEYEDVPPDVAAFYWFWDGYCTVQCDTEEERQSVNEQYARIQEESYGC